jgi:hypothetical protein
VGPFSMAWYSKNRRSSSVTYLGFWGAGWGRGWGMGVRGEGWSRAARNTGGCTGAAGRAGGGLRRVGGGGRGAARARGPRRSMRPGEAPTRRQAGRAHRARAPAPRGLPQNNSPPPGAPRSPLGGAPATGRVEVAADRGVEERAAARERRGPLERPPAAARRLDCRADERAQRAGAHDVVPHLAAGAAGGAGSDGACGVGAARGAARDGAVGARWRPAAAAAAAAPRARPAGPPARPNCVAQGATRVPGPAAHRRMTTRW